MPAGCHKDIPDSSCLRVISLHSLNKFRNLDQSKRISTEKQIEQAGAMFYDYFLL